MAMNAQNVLLDSKANDLQNTKCGTQTPAKANKLQTKSLFKPSKTTKPYRKNAGIMIVNQDKKIWMGLRSDAGFYKNNLARQMPQGGIDAGENEEQAAWRELYEETGLTQKTAKLIAVSKNWYSYDFPKGIKAARKFKGQTQKWFLFLLTGTDASFDLRTQQHIEFSSFEWVDLKDVSACVVSFKQPVYEQVAKEFAPIIEQLDIKDE